MTRDIILVKLESLSHCIKRIEDKRPKLAEDLMKNLDLQDILSVNLERAIQICVDISSHIIADRDIPSPTTMADSFLALKATGIINDKLSERMRKAVGFRNISVHEYDKIDWNIVFSIVHYRLNDFKDFASAIFKDTSY